MNKLSQLLLILLVLMLTLVLCGGKYEEKNYTHEVYYNYEEGSFYIREIGADEKGKLYQPHFGEEDKQKIKKLEKELTEEYYSIQKLARKRAVKRAKIFLTVAGVIILIVLILIFRFIWKLIKGKEEEK